MAETNRIALFSGVSLLIAGVLGFYFGIRGAESYAVYGINAWYITGLILMVSGGLMIWSVVRNHY